MNILEDMLIPALEGYNFISNDNKENIRASEYHVSPGSGHGTYKFFAKEDMYYISVIDVVFWEDVIMEQHNPRCMSVNCYYSISGEMLNPYRSINCNCINGYVSKDEYYRAVYHHHVPIDSVSITIFPAYYENYLNERFPGMFSEPQDAFLSIDGAVDFHEMQLLFNQIKHYQGQGAVAELFFNSKVDEAVSLIIDRTRREQKSMQNTKTTTYRITDDDIQCIKTVRRYIDDHFFMDLRVDQLAKIACMGTSKFKFAFKKLYKMTVTDYITHKRLGHAEHLLISTNLGIQDIVKHIGYTHAGYFSRMFKQYRGVSPSEFRHLLKKE